MAVFEQDLASFEGELKLKAPQLKHIVALLIEGELTKATYLWNSLGLKPVLDGVELDEAQNIMRLFPKKEAAIEMPLGQLIAELQALLSKP